MKHRLKKYKIQKDVFFQLHGKKRLFVLAFIPGKVKYAIHLIDEFIHKQLEEKGFKYYTYSK